ncbi:hypothetical protein AOQ84DRAFT_437008 [Glonium stellatum]|uniref:RNA polymerase I-specific transcription initiation factor RRN6-like protein n=1 Tax=Glonium stellatum TaxID=574774 RepID=A0A8E2F8M4_9PEZI|nr:hypothetical protein AOQ84DRAFT_437008 [Glonium stellatum]
MAEFSVNDLNFGHFGEAVYHPESQEWLFSRKPGRRRVLQVLGPFKASIPPSIRSEHPLSLDIKRPTHVFQTRTQSLVRSNPEIVPAFELLTPLARVSAAIISQVSNYDPVNGDLLAYGRAADVDNKRGKGRVRVAAIAAGEGREVLRLIQIREGRQGWREDRSVWLEVPTLDGESGWWVGDGAPIRQLCFAYSDDRATFLAVRMPTKTVIFRPLYHSSPVAPPNLPPYQLPPSRLNPYPVLSISIDQTGGVPHADVAFNPWYQRQVAFIDQEGAWSIWDIAGQQRKRLGYTAECFKTGTLVPLKPEPEDQVPKGAPDHEDGWARILWVGDVNTIVACSRRQLALFDLRGGIGKTTRLKCPTLDMPRTANWILDTKRSPQNHHQFFVLTSSHLFLLEVQCLDNEDDDSEEKAGANVILSWRHFRGIEDITLQLTMVGEGEEEILLMLYSRVNTLITTFRFFQSIEEPLQSASISDPTELRLPESLFNAAKAPEIISALSLERIQFNEDYRFQGHGPGPGSSYMNNDIRFYGLTIALGDLSTHEVLLYSLNPELEAHRNSPSNQVTVEIPSWHKKGSNAQYTYRSTAKVTGNSFIVPDGAIDEPGNDTLGAQLLSKPLQYPKLLYSKPKMKRDGDNSPWAVDNAFSYQEITNLGANEEKGLENAEEVVSVCERINNKLNEEAAAQDEPLNTLFDFARSFIKVTDIDEASLILQELLQAPLRTLDADIPSFEIKKIASTSYLRLIGLEKNDFSIATVFEDILRTLIAPLPRNIPREMRKVEEKLARRIAAESLLASFRVRFHETDMRIISPEMQQETSQSSSIALPVRSSEKGKERESSVFSEPSSSHYSTSSQAVPSLPTPETTPSLISGSSFTSFSSGLSDGPINRLKQHIHMSKPPSPQNHPGYQLLMHWQRHLNQDPKTYDWEATTRAIQEESDAEGDGLSTSRRARLQRRAERHLKRQRRETAAAAAATSASQPLLATELAQYRSSPGPAMSGVGSSQTGGVGSSQMGVASQLERGAFGGRPVAKKTKKTKTPGFR